MKKHGESKTREYRSWKTMHYRCKSPNCESYPNYGGRGIKVCDRWNDYLNFLEDMGRCPPKYSLDRINNDGNYEPGNCRWANGFQQGNNKRGLKNQRTLDKLLSKGIN